MMFLPRLMAIRAAPWPLSVPVVVDPHMPLGYYKRQGLLMFTTLARVCVGTDRPRVGWQETCPSYLATAVDGTVRRLVTHSFAH